MPFDKFPARRHVVAHQHREDTIRFGGALDIHLTQDTRFGRHGRFPQLFGIHFPQTFVTLYMGPFRPEFRQSRLALLFRPTIATILTLFDLIERRRRDIDVSVFDQVVHVAEEER